jgi:hypothetical protein
MKRLMSLALLVCFLLFGFGIANAFPLYPGSGTTAGTLIEDDDYDYFVDNNDDGFLTVGDHLFAAAEFVKIEDILAPFSASSPYDLDDSIDELVAWSELEVTSIDDDGKFWFGEVDNNPMISVYTGGSDLQLTTENDPTLAEARTAATDGTFLWSFSIDPSDADTYWNFVPSIDDADDPSVVAGLGSATKVGTLNFQLNQVGGDDIFNLQQGLDFGDDGLVDLVGSGDILGGSGLTHAFARSDADVTLNPIPEPTTLLLFGTGLLGLAAFGRKRFMKK